MRLEDNKQLMCSDFFYLNFQIQDSVTSVKAMKYFNIYDKLGIFDMQKFLP